MAARTGGLADSVEDGVTGFLFDEISLAGLLSAIYRAVDTFRSARKPDAMRRAAMKCPFGWERSALQYEAVYQSTLSSAST